MTKPNFKAFSLFASKSDSKEKWQRKAREEIAQNMEELLFETNEHIKIKALYTSEDRQNLEQLEHLPGLPPYTRGPYPTMYVNRPWTVRQYAGFSTAEESNAFYRRNLAMG